MSDAARTLYVTDLDGTLLRTDGTLGRYTISTVNDFIDAGGLFTYATARGFHRAQQATAGLRLELPVITYGGAVVLDPVAGAALRTATVPASTVEAVLSGAATAAQQPVLFFLHEGVDRVGWIADPVGGLSAGVQDFLQRRRADPRLLPLTEWSGVDLDQVFYLSMIDDREPLQQFRTALGTALDGCEVVLAEDVYTPGRYMLDVTSAAATKSAALAEVMQRTGADRLVCFGDNLNDLSMFAVADEAYAVGNAVAQVQQLATAVIGRNDDEGVARWLQNVRGMG